MRVTFLGHAALYIETHGASILCDPWLSGPAYYGSWWPYPDTDGVDADAIGRPTYLYISHLHHDHFDADFLRDRVSKDAIVLLPDYPLGALETELRRLGFTRFWQTRSWEPFEADGMRLTIPAMVSPADGPIGDSGLLVEADGVTLFNQNDCRPVDGLDRLGHVDVHFVQFSGAIGYPFLQGYPERMRVALGRRKRLVGMERARRYVQAVGADLVFPSSGPACFLDPNLFWLNDVGDDDGNVFPDQFQFFDYMERRGSKRPGPVFPGSVIELTGGDPRVTHPRQYAMADLDTPAGKRRYLAEYQSRKRSVIEGRDDSLVGGDVDVVRELREWWTPLLAGADVICAGINGRMAIDFEDVRGGAVVVDFRERTVQPWQHDEVEHHFSVPRALLADCVRKRREDWCTDLLLSFRFQERSKGRYNKFLYAFLSALSEERIRYVEDFYRQEAHREAGGQPFFHMDLGGRQYVVQRRCPHDSGDLARFLEYDDATGTLTCTLHGWQWRQDGACLTADGHPLYVKPVEEVVALAADVRRQCSDCAYGLRPPALVPINGEAGGSFVTPAFATED